jgi:hypothetical protein
VLENLNGWRRPDGISRLNVHGIAAMLGAFWKAEATSPPWIV